MSLKVHDNIVHKLDEFMRLGKIPNIIFYGPNGSGKRTLVNNFVSKLYYHDKYAIRSYVLHANCAHCKGIKFVREELKFFAKTHISLGMINNFKTIILSNADSLTIDAQSALRRCIEQFSHNTRFFVIVNDTARLLKPILSRFCELYVPNPIVNSRKINLYRHNSILCFGKETDTSTWLKKQLMSIKGKAVRQIMTIIDAIYERGYSGRDVLTYIERCDSIESCKKTELLLTFHKVKKDFRNEKLFIMFMLIRFDSVLENVSFM